MSSVVQNGDNYCLFFLFYFFHFEYYLLSYFKDIVGNILSVKHATQHEVDLILTTV